MQSSTNMIQFRRKRLNKSSTHSERWFFFLKKKGGGRQVRERERESNGNSKRGKSRGDLRVLIGQCPGYASDTHFLLQQNCILPAGKEQQFTCSTGRTPLKNQREAAGRNLWSRSSSPTPQTEGLGRGLFKFCTGASGRGCLPCQLRNISFELHQ